VNERQTAEVARAIQDVTERAQIVVREEIELAKAEISTKVSKLARGAAIGAAAGVFLLGALIYGLHALAWLIWGVFDFEGEEVWIGFAFVTAGLVLLALIAGLIAYRLVKKSAPPKPEYAIQEAQLIAETVSHPPGPARRNGA